MLIKYSYNHLHAEDYLYYRKIDLINEIKDCLNSVDANMFLKVSCDKTNLGMIYYDQKALNQEIKNRLIQKGWDEFKTSYYVTSDLNTTKKIVKIADADKQKQIIIDNNQIPLLSHNQVDFLKDRVAVEVQFGKYFSVAYDLHVKHTFFYIRDDIEVGIEIIPTHKMMSCMDTGVAWYENEVTNVIREGRNNPSVPVYILGIEPDNCINTNPVNFSDDDLREIVERCDKALLRRQITLAKAQDETTFNRNIAKAKEKADALQIQIDELNGRYLEIENSSIGTNNKAALKFANQLAKLQIKLDEANDKYNDAINNPPDRLIRIHKLEQFL